jgi:hypothetical protein
MVLAVAEIILTLTAMPFRRSDLRQALAARADEKNLKLFFALQTLNENGVEVENQPSHPA